VPSADASSVEKGDFLFPAADPVNLQFTDAIAQDPSGLHKPRLASGVEIGTPPAPFALPRIPSYIAQHAILPSLSSDALPFALT